MPALDFPPGTTGATYTGPGGVIWVYDGAKWVSGTLTTGIYAPIINDVGRNLIHNSLMTIAQRTLPVTATGYTLDRWRAETATDTISFSQVALADADRAAIGDEEAINALQNVFGGTGGAGAYNMVHQRIESPRRMSGDTVTVSFWAKATSGAPKIGISIDQVWNSVASNGTGVAVTLATTWARYTATIVVPSGTGKTQIATDYTQLNLWFSSGTTNATRAGSIGVQTGPFTVQIWGVQLELGSVATPLEKLDPVTQLQQCQRFFCTCNAGWFGTGQAGNLCGGTVMFPVQMRAAPPTIVFASTTYTNTNTIQTITGSPYGWTVGAVVGATGQASFTTSFTASADL